MTPFPPMPLVIVSLLKTVSRIEHGAFGHNEQLVVVWFGFSITI